MNRTPEVVDRDIINVIVLNSLRASMPRTGPQGFSEQALFTGEVGRMLKALAAMITEDYWRVKAWSRQLTPTDAGEDYIDVVARSKGLGGRLTTEDANTYIQRVMQQFRIVGVTYENIKANLEYLGYDCDITPQGDNLFVPSIFGRTPSTRQALMPNAFRSRSGVFVADVWGPTPGKAGVAKLLYDQSSSGYSFIFRNHIHWNGPDDLIAGSTGVMYQRRRKRSFYAPTDNARFVPSSHLGVPSVAGRYPSGDLRSRYQRKRHRHYLAPEPGVMAYLPILVDLIENRYVDLDFDNPGPSGGPLSYTVVTEPLTVDSGRTCLQAGMRFSKRSV